MKYLVINLTKNVNDLCKKNYKPSSERVQRRLQKVEKISHDHGLAESA
jgi:hypothetical protein